jgi:transcriptional regulator NrdR family protein
MSAMAPARRSSFGMSCFHCDSELIAPEWTEHRNERHIRHLWHCSKCHCRFETVVGNQDGGKFDR